MDYTKCQKCGQGKPPASEREEYFLYCSMECKEQTLAERTARRLEHARTHNPWDRMTEAERTVQCRLLNTAGPVVWNAEAFQAAQDAHDGTLGGEPKKRADGKVDGRAKGMRKCGKCGDAGHNARTCNGPKKPALVSDNASSMQVKSAVTGSPGSPEVPKDVLPEPASNKKTNPGREAVRASKKTPGRKKRKAEAKGSRKCGACGGNGHNARTCKA